MNLLSVKEDIVYVKFKILKAGGFLIPTAPYTGTYVDEVFGAGGNALGCSVLKYFFCIF